MCRDPSDAILAKMSYSRRSNPPKSEASSSLIHLSDTDKMPPDKMDDDHSDMNERYFDWWNVGYLSAYIIDVRPASSA